MYAKNILFKARQLALLVLAILVLTVATAPMVAAEVSWDDLGSINDKFPFYDQTPVGCGVGGNQLIGSDVAEKVFNFLIEKGLEPFQAAGVLGNMQAESGVRTNIVQGGALSDIPTEAGYGLVQWTPGTQLNAAAKEAGVKPSDLEFQLNFLWTELTTNEKAAGDALKATRTVEEATIAFETKFERHAGGVQEERQRFAADFLARYGSSSTSGSTTSDTRACSQGEVNGDFSLPVDKHFYDENPDWFSKPHHDYSAADIPVPTGTPVYSMTSGKVIAAPVGGGCGNGVAIDAGDNIEFLYCHGLDGGSINGAKTGDTVNPGQVIMNSDDTGHSTGPHLHIQVKINGVNHCPQSLFAAIADNRTINLNTLPTGGCSY